MFYYHAFGLNISSEIELLGMTEGSKLDKSHVEIIIGEIHLPPHEGSFKYLVEQNDAYLWWDDIGKVKVTNGKKITIDPIDENQIIPYILGPIMAILLHQRGFLVLHGSAVNISNVASALLGYAGIGKSTIAMNLYKKGYPLITDDLLAIKFDEEGKPLIYPGYFHLRLSNDSYKDIKDSTYIPKCITTITGKAFCEASQGFSTDPIRLREIYLLKNGDKIGITSADSQKDLLDLIRHSLAHRIFNDHDQINNLIQCANLINNVHIYRLITVHSFEDIPKLINLIEEKSSQIKI